MLEITQLNQFYGGSHILWDVNLSVPAGSFPGQTTPIVSVGSWSLILSRPTLQ